jgi:hypothetical protein
MEYKILKEKDKRPAGYEYSDKGRNNWRKGSWVGAKITTHELELFDFRAPITKRQIKIERTPHRTYTVTAIAEAQKSAAEIRKLCRRISIISHKIDKILEGRY